MTGAHRPCGDRDFRLPDLFLASLISRLCPSVSSVTSSFPLPSSSQSGVSLLHPGPSRAHPSPPPPHAPHSLTWAETAAPQLLCFHLGQCPRPGSGGPEPEGPGVLAKSLGPAGAGSRELKEVGAPAGTWGHLGPMATSTLSQPHAWWLGDPAGDGNTPPGS